jgi:hypothetical protein
LKQRVLLCASIFVFALVAPRWGLAQAVPPPYPGTIYPGDGALPPYEIVAIVSSTGLEPLGRPIRQGPAYAVRAVDAAGEEVRVIVDARLGRIVKVVPLMEPRYAMPLMRPPFGRPPRPIAMVPNGGLEGPPLNGPGKAGLQGGLVAGVPRDPAAQAGPPPLPRPRPKVAATESPAPANPASAPSEYDYE